MERGATGLKRNLLEAHIQQIDDEFPVAQSLALLQKKLANLGDLKACDHGRGKGRIAKLFLRTLGSRPRPIDLLKNVLAWKLRCDLAIPARNGSVNQRARSALDTSGPKPSAWGWSRAHRQRLVLPEAVQCPFSDIGNSFAVRVTAGLISERVRMRLSLRFAQPCNR